MTRNFPVAFICSMLWCGMTSAATQCGLLPLDLPGLPTDDAETTDINNSGAVVGRSAQGPFIWSAGVITYLTAHDGASTNAFPLGLNNKGRVVGSALGLDGNQHATIWNNGVPQDLGLLPAGDGSRAEDINELGHVVGSAVGSDTRVHAFIWTGQELTLLPDGLPNRGSVAMAINNLDQVVGYDIDPGTRTPRAVMWDHGTVTYLGSFGNAGNSVAHDINDSGQIVGGSATTAAGTYRAFLWEHGQLRNLGALGGNTSQALAINSHGVVVGNSTNSNNRWQAFIWKNGAMKHLDPATATKGSAALAISNTGWVTGYTRKPPAQFRNRAPFRWKKKC